MKRPDLFNYWTLVVFCVSASLLGIWVGGWLTHRSADGGRGGAVAVAVALFALFISRGYGRRLIEARAEDIPAQIRRLEALGKIAPGSAGRPETFDKEKTEELSLDSLAKEQKLQNKFLAWSTGFGTLVWGFGDLIVKLILHCRGIAERQ